MLQLFMRHGSTLKYADLHAVRMVVEVVAAQAAAKYATDDSIERLYLLCDELETLSEDIIQASRNDM